LTFSLHTKTADVLTEDITLNEEDIPPSFETLMSLIQQLPNQYRLIFNLYEIDGYAHKDIGTLLNISESTSKSNLHRAKKILKEKILEQNNKGAIKTFEHGK